MSCMALAASAMFGNTYPFQFMLMLMQTSFLSVLPFDMEHLFIRRA